MMRYVSLGLLIGLPTTAGLGMFLSNLVPSALTQRTALMPAAIVALYFFVGLLGAPNALFPGRAQRAFMRHRILRSAWLHASITASGMFLLGYVVFSVSLPWTYTSLFGSTVEERFVVAGWEGTSRWHCARPRVEGRFTAFSFHAFCGGPYAGRRLPVGTPVRVVGKRTVWGILTTAVTVDPSAQAAP